MKNNKNNFAVISGYQVCVPQSLNNKELVNNLKSFNHPLKSYKLDNEDVFLSKFSDQEIQKVLLMYPDIDLSNLDIKTVFLIKTIENALKNANLNLDSINKDDVFMLFSTCQVGLERSEKISKDFLFKQEDNLVDDDFLGIHYSYISKYLSKYFKIQNAIVSFSSACAASNNALGYAKDLITLKKAKVVIVASLDTYAISTVAGFYSLKAQVAKKTTPFSKSVGLNLGEGCGVMIIENPDRFSNIELAQKWKITGYGLSGDSYHITAPRPDGVGATNAMQEALRDAEVVSSDIDYIKAHGTGTAANDDAESSAIFGVFGNSIPVSSLKSFFGHTLGSSGIIEIIACLLLNEEELLPPNYNFEEQRETVKSLNYLPKDFIKKDINTFIANSFAFGGLNSACIFQKKLSKEHVNLNKNQSIYINATGIYNKFGTLNNDVFNSLTISKDRFNYYENSGLNAGIIDSIKLKDDLISFNRSSKQTKLMISSLKEIVDNNPNLKNNFKTGLIAGALSVSCDSLEKYMQSVFEESPTLASAFYFPMNTLSTVVGVSSIAHKIIGYTTTILGTISSFVYSLSLFESNRQDNILLTSSDDINENFLYFHKNRGYALNTIDFVNNTKGLVFADNSVSLLLSNTKAKDSVEILAYESLSIFGNNNLNPYETLISTILSKNNINEKDIAGVFITSCEIGYNAEMLDNTLTKYFTNNPIVNSVDSKLGYGFSTVFLNSIWFAYQCLQKGIIPNINFESKKSYINKKETILQEKDKILVISGDITGNCIAVLLSK